MATTLSVWKFDSPTGAEKVRDKLIALSKQELITIHDAAVVSWEEGKKKPKTKQLMNTTAAGASTGMFWGLLFGVLFLVPLFGMAVGAAMGALSGSMVDLGVDDDFIKAVREKVTPGTSALFLLTSDAVRDRVREGLGDDVAGAELIATNLSVEDEQALRELIVEDED